MLSFFASFICLETVNAQSHSSEWQIEFQEPANGRSAALHVFSTVTGHYNQLYVQEGKWLKNPHYPSPKTSLSKNNLAMQYVEGNDSMYPYMCIYSRSTGEWEQLYLENAKWKKNENFGNPPISIRKGDLEIEFIPGTNESFPGLIVTSNKTKDIEIFYFDNGNWQVNDSYPIGLGM